MVYEIELTINSDLVCSDTSDREIAENFSNIESIKNKRCASHDVCFNYALNKISKELGQNILFCEDGFEFLYDYFEQIPIEEARKGDIITYHELNDFKSKYERPCAENTYHFAIIYSADGILNNTIVHSKWGRHGVFKGNIADTFDIYGNAVVIWRIK